METKTVSSGVVFFWGGGWQVKQLLYGPARRQRLGATEDTSSAMEQAQETALLSELAEGDFAVDQNVVEVCVVRT